MCILTAQARANCASRSWAPYFVGKFWHETADVNVNFDLRKLAQNGCPVPGARHFMTSSWDSLWGPGVKLSKFLVTQACGDPSGMLSEAFAWSCTGPCEKLLKRSWRNPLGVLTWSGILYPCGKILRRFCWNPPHQVLALRSWRCVALMHVWNLFWGAHRKLLCEDLLRSSI